MDGVFVQLVLFLTQNQFPFDLGSLQRHHDERSSVGCEDQPPRMALRKVWNVIELSTVRLNLNQHTGSFDAMDQRSRGGTTRNTMMLLCSARATVADCVSRCGDTMVTLGGMNARDVVTTYGEINILFKDLLSVMGIFMAKCVRRGFVDIAVSESWVVGDSVADARSRCENIR